MCLAVGFGLPGLGVDTHVKRVAQLGLAHTQNADKVEKELKALIPQEMWSKSHHLLIWHGRRPVRPVHRNAGRCWILCAPKLNESARA